MLRIGEKAPEFVLKLHTGHRFRLADCLASAMWCCISTQRFFLLNIDVDEIFSMHLMPYGGSVLRSSTNEESIAARRITNF
jgi:hypothetical protein